MIRLRRAGWFLKDIAELAGPPWTMSRVRHLMDKLGVQPDEKPVRVGVRNHIKHQFPRWLLVEMYWGCELSKNEIAYELDIKEPSLNAIFRRLQIKTRTVVEARAISAARYPHSVHQLSDDDRALGHQESAKTRARRRHKNEIKRSWLARRAEQDHQAELVRRRRRRTEREQAEREQYAA
jgi:hypothetical protein